MIPPIKNFSWKTCTQLFGVNKDLYFQNFGIQGHNGIDISTFYGDEIVAAHDGIVVKITYDNPHRSNGNGIYLMTKDNRYATAYWHLSQFADEVRAGAEIKEGQFIGLEGNSGFVQPLPTDENPRAGTHLHFAVYDYQNTGNEYGGFIDPLPFLFRQGDRIPINFTRDLYLGRSGDDVSWLQTILKLEGVADFLPIGTFGAKTLASVIKYQQKYGISPSVGWCGTKTRSLLNYQYKL